MRRIFNLFVVILLSATPSHAALRWHTSTIDVVPNNEGNAEAIFAFTNVGGVTVTILRIEQDCGCTKVTHGARALAPGESSYIKASVSLRNKYGMQRLKILVTTDDIEERTHTLVIKANLAELLTLSNRKIYFSLQSMPTPQTITVHVHHDIQQIRLITSEAIKVNVTLSVAALNEAVENMTRKYVITVEAKSTVRGWKGIVRVQGVLKEGEKYAEDFFEIAME